VAIQFGASLEGAEEFRRQLRQMSSGARREAVVKAATAMGELLLPKVLERVPVESGTLRDAYEVQVSATKDFEAVATVGADPKKLEARGRYSDGSGKRAPYDRFVEYGTVHAPAQPHLRPAFDEASQQAADAGIGEFELFLDEQVGEAA
jgi:HK97 gp10 family phage protein